MDTHYVLLGSKKNGCAIDNDNHRIVQYENLSLYEKLKGEDGIHTFPYENIHSLDIGFNYVNGVRSGSTNIILTIHFHTQDQYSFGLFNESLINPYSREDINHWIHALIAAPININDQYHLLDSILTSQESVGNIIAQLHKNI